MDKSHNEGERDNEKDAPTSKLAQRFVNITQQSTAVPWQNFKRKEQGIDFENQELTEKVEIAMKAKVKKA